MAESQHGIQSAYGALGTAARRWLRSLLGELVIAQPWGLSVGAGKHPHGHVGTNCATRMVAADTVAQCGGAFCAHVVVTGQLRMPELRNRYLGCCAIPLLRLVINFISARGGQEWS